MVSVTVTGAAVCVGAVVTFSVTVGVVVTFSVTVAVSVTGSAVFVTG